MTEPRESNWAGTLEERGPPFVELIGSRFGWVLFSLLFSLVPPFALMCVLRFWSPNEIVQSWPPLVPVEFALYSVVAPMSAGYGWDPVVAICLAAGILSHILWRHPVTKMITLACAVLWTLNGALLLADVM